MRLHTEVPGDVRLLGAWDRAVHVVIAILDPQARDHVVLVVASCTEEVQVGVGPAARVLHGRVESGKARGGSDQEASPRARDDVLEGDGEVEVLRQCGTVTDHGRSNGRRCGASRSNDGLWAGSMAIDGTATPCWRFALNRKLACITVSVIVQ